MANFQVIEESCKQYFFIVHKKLNETWLLWFYTSWSKFNIGPKQNENTKNDSGLFLNQFKKKKNTLTDLTIFLKSVKSTKTLSFNSQWY